MRAILLILTKVAFSVPVQFTESYAIALPFSLSSRLTRPTIIGSFLGTSTIDSRPLFFFAREESHPLLPLAGLEFAAIQQPLHPTTKPPCRLLRMLLTHVALVPRLEMDGCGHQNSFEVFGFDFFIDESYKPWLIEVRGGTSSVIDSPLITMHD